MFAAKRTEQVLQPLVLNIALALQLLARKNVAPSAPLDSSNGVESLLLEPRHEQLSVFEELNNVEVFARPELRPD